MDLLATVLAATAAIELLSALLFAFTFVRRPSERDFGVASIACVAASVHTLGSELAASAQDPAAALVDDRVAWLGLLVLEALVVHFALLYRGGRPRPLVAAVSYAVAAVFVGLDLRGLLHDPSGAVPRASGILVVASDSTHRIAPLGPFGTLAYLGAVVAAATVLVFVARAYLAGYREALAVVVGATVLLATSINDLGVAAGVLTTGYLVDAGLAAFVVGIATTPSARYAAVHADLEKRTKELRTRSRELRRSYEDLRVTQEELVKKEQLAVVGELAAVIAHEVRNPLAIIGNAVAGLRKPISREDHDTLLSILDEEASRLNRLVSDLLRYARPVNVQRQQFSLTDLLDRALGLASTPHPGIRAELKIECHEGRVWGDANLLRQVFDNLVDNAVQAMGSAGTLTVRLRSTTEDGVDGLAVDIIDTGEGMDTQVRSRARDPFFTTRPSGTGLGLAIVDRIVLAHGGHFAIDSRSGEGTTVTVFLPHGSPSEPPPPRSRGTRQISEPPRSERVGK